MSRSRAPFLPSPLTTPLAVDIFTPGNRPKWPWIDCLPEYAWRGELARSVPFTEYVQGLEGERNDEQTKAATAVWCWEFGYTVFEAPFDTPFMLTLPPWSSRAELGLSPEGLTLTNTFLNGVAVGVAGCGSGSRVVVSTPQFPLAAPLSLCSRRLLCDTWAVVLDWALDVYRGRPSPLHEWLDLSLRERLLLVQPAESAHAALIAARVVDAADPKGAADRATAFRVDRTAAMAKATELIAASQAAPVSDTVAALLELCEARGQLPDKWLVPFVARSWRCSLRHAYAPLAGRTGPEILVKAALS